MPCVCVIIEVAHSCVTLWIMTAKTTIVANSKRRVKLYNLGLKRTPSLCMYSEQEFMKMRQLLSDKESIGSNLVTVYYYLMTRLDLLNSYLSLIFSLAVFEENVEVLS